MIYIKELNLEFKRIQILKEINLTLEKGKVHGFVGPNGCGKTMLFRVISGLVKPTSGEVVVDGVTIFKQASFPENLGLLIESPGFWSQYSATENLKIIASIRNVINDDDIADAIRRVGLDPSNKLKYSKFSLGMKQKLGIAQAIMEKPELIILDEPTNALDEDSVKNIREIIKEEQKRGATILLASHNKDDISELCDHIYKFNCGYITKVEGV
ncbi:MAG: ABC transporter ATP-binding protein [Clostridium sp.]